MDSLLLFLLLLFLYWITDGDGGKLWLIIISVGLIGWALYKNMDRVEKIIDWVWGNSRRQCFIKSLLPCGFAAAFVLAIVSAIFSWPAKSLWLAVPLTVVFSAYITRNS